ncbi:C39 family peptidase [Candidatus Kaiserbacteria bacterium]|nr:C39 family peptidase [Candidatus Kaiserbacteria bacterium]
MELLPVQPFQETYLNQSLCAPATLKMLLMFWNLPGQEKTDLELATVLGTDPDLGTTNETFLKELKQFGLEAIVKDHATYEDVQEWLDKKIPVVVDWFSPGPEGSAEDEMPDGHYSIVVGLDDENIYLQDPEIGHLRTVSRRHFFRVWFDFTTDWIEHKDNMIIRWMAAVYPQGKGRRV